ncbi:putative membrane protein [Rhodoferax antarcticus ANT.BR]|uniref:Putative membrane protein n=1 Tax=Rhodoferax antarcticus ANT.BR TaxID=1111071 RepID=A0A1Q8YCX6_9BURK|nr:putative membrane protein [Rhodoferax antarcticus ANT.BR]
MLVKLAKLAAVASTPAKLTAVAAALGAPVLAAGSGLTGLLIPLI